MGACSNEIEEPVMRLKRNPSFSGLEIENSPRAVRRKLIAALTEVSENGNSNSVDLCLVKDGQNCTDENIHGEEQNLSLDSLHTSILVEIICKVSHDQLDSLSTVSDNFEEAVNVAKEIHFDYTTPTVCVKSPESSLLNAPKRPESSRISRLSAEDIKKLQNLARQARTMIEANSFLLNVPKNS